MFANFPWICSTRSTMAMTCSICTLSCDYWTFSVHLRVIIGTFLVGFVPKKKIYVCATGWKINMYMQVHGIQLHGITYCTVLMSSIFVQCNDIKEIRGVSNIVTKIGWIWIRFDIPGVWICSVNSDIIFSMVSVLIWKHQGWRSHSETI